MNNYLKLIDTVWLPPTKGEETIVQSKIFSYLDPDFKEWGTDVASEDTLEMKVEVYELTKDGKFSDFLPDVWLTQGQVLSFVANHKELLHLKDRTTFFPFRVNGEKFVADAGRRSDGQLGAFVRRFGCAGVWVAGGRFRIVVPQHPSQPSPSGSPALSLLCPYCQKKVKLGLIKHE